MGQAFRRAAGRIGSSGMETSSSQLKKPIERPPPPPPEIISAQNAGTEAGKCRKANSLNEFNALS